MAPGKAHKGGHAGRKVAKKDAMRKKKLGDVGESGMTSAQKNPKAFTFKSARRAQKQMSRSADKEQKRFHLPMLDKSAADPPPYVVLVQGPPKVGKSTLIRCLIRHYTRQIVNDLKGPITVVAGKARRLTFVECPSDLNGLIDAAKYADLVLLCVDGSFGFEMETFEFLNLLQSHGFPKVMGVLTHLDKISDVTKMRKMKKKLKARFWTEIHNGARLFYLTDFRNRKYLHNEVKNLARFLSVMKMRPIAWRLNHPYIVADRFEDCSLPESIRENPKCDRSVYLYGYLRGCNLRLDARVHLSGVGDFTLDEVEALLDPCPFPETLKKRGLNEKERVLYAPLTNLGGFVYDKDAVYIDIPDWKVQFSKEMGGEEPAPRGTGGEAMVRKLQRTRQTIDEKLNNTPFKLFEGGAEISEYDPEDIEHGPEDEDSYDDENPASKRTSPQEFDVVHEGGRVRRRVTFDTSEKPGPGLPLDDNQEEYSSDVDSSDEDSQEPEDQEIAEGLGRAGAWKVGIKDRAAAIHTDYQKDLQKFIYSRKSTVEEAGDGYFCEEADSSRVMPPLSIMDKWTEDGAISSVKNRFVSGDWNVGSRRNRQEQDDDEEEGNSSGSDMYGDFEDLEIGELHSGDAAVKAARKAIDDVAAEERREKKKARKALFNKQYDDRGQGQESGADDEEEEEDEGDTRPGGRPGKEQTYYDAVKEEMAQKLLRTREVLDGLSTQRRISMEGHLAGTYVRIKLKGVPCEMVDCFDGSRPILLGGLGPGEDRLGCMKLRLKKHRWFPKILKTRDPLIFSVGWRRFQSLPIFAVEDHNRRIRMLKYTPEHSHCIAAMWGPTTPPNSGFVAVQDLSSNVQSWRVCATGTVVELEADFRIVKKLKLLGTPFKVQKNTAFISGMFNSQLEVSKFEGASIRTVSGIRGTVKKPVRDGTMGGPPGLFRATFEDKVLRSDIVFLRSWVSVEIPKFCNMVTNMLFRTSKDSRQFERSDSKDLEGLSEHGEDHLKTVGIPYVEEFEASSCFHGRKPGYVFKTGDSGLGYYRDLLAPLSVTGPAELESKGPEWRRMRTVAELRREHGIGAPKIGDSEYRSVERAARKWLPMQIPKSLIAELPIKTKPTVKSKSKDALKAERAVVVREPSEKKMANLLKQLRTIQNEKIRKRKDLKLKQRQLHEKKLKEEAKWRDVYNKEMREHRYKGRTVTTRKQASSSTK